MTELELREPFDLDEKTLHRCFERALLNPPPFHRWYAHYIEVEVLRKKAESEVGVAMLASSYNRMIRRAVQMEGALDDLLMLIDILDVDDRYDVDIARDVLADFRKEFRKEKQ